MVNKLIYNNSKHFWRVCPTMQDNNSKSNDKFVGGIRDSQNICSNFKDTFVSNFNDSWQGKLCKEFKLLEPSIMNDIMRCNNIIFSQNDALLAFLKLKLGKAASPDGVSADCIKYADLLLSY